MNLLTTCFNALRRARRSGYTRLLTDIVLRRTNTVMVFRTKKEADDFDGGKGISLHELDSFIRNMDHKRPTLILFDNSTLLYLFESADKKINYLQSKCDKYENAFVQIREIANQQVYWQKKIIE